MSSGPRPPTLVPMLFADIAHQFPDRDRPSPGRCPVCGTPDGACVPHGYTPPAVTDRLPERRDATEPIDLPDDTFEWADDTSPFVRVKHDVYGKITYQGARSPGTVLLFPTGAVIPKRDAQRMRALYAEDQALHPGEVK